MRIFKTTTLLIILSAFAIILSACNKSSDINNSVADNNINITEEAPEVTEESTKATVTTEAKTLKESDAKTKKAKTKDNKSTKKSTTKTDNKETETTKEPVKDTKASPPKTSNKSTKKSSTTNKANNNKETLTCSLRIECREILDGNLDKLSIPKRALVPKDGIIYDNTSITFEEGDTVWDVLSKEVKKNSILMEYSYVPVYKTNYIEGIAGLYEFDAGDTSGWRYMVNGQYPAYGCDKYKLKNNDKIVWHYTVKLE